MSELAFDESGQQFPVPATVARWRARRFNKPGKAGGAQVVYGEDGLPLFLDVDTSAEEFRVAVNGKPGRYRLDGVDANGQLVGGVPAAYLEISGEIAARASGAHGAVPPPAATSMEFALVEVARANSDALKMVAEKFGGICEAVAKVMSAADAAGLPRRAPLGPLLIDHPADDDGDDDQEERNAQAPKLTIATVLGQAMQMMQAFVHMRGGDPAKVGALMAPVVETAKAAEASAAATSTTRASTSEDREAMDEREPATASSRPVDTAGFGRSSPTKSSSLGAADPMAHLNAVMAALTPTEQARVHHVVTTLSMRDLMLWADQLAPLSIPEAVARIRAELARIPAEQT